MSRRVLNLSFRTISSGALLIKGLWDGLALLHSFIKIKEQPDFGWDNIYDRLKGYFFLYDAKEKILCNVTKQRENNCLLFPFCYQSNISLILKGINYYLLDSIHMVFIGRAQEDATSLVKNLPYSSTIILINTLDNPPYNPIADELLFHALNHEKNPFLNFINAIISYPGSSTFYINNYGVVAKFEVRYEFKDSDINHLKALQNEKICQFVEFLGINSVESFKAQISDFSCDPIFRLPGHYQTLQDERINDFIKYKFFLSIAEADMKSFNMIVYNGFNIEATLSDGTNGLIFAAFNGQSTMIQFFLQHGLNVSSCKNNNSSALALAAFNRQEASIKILLEAGADTNQANTDGNTPLMYVTRNSDVNIAHLFLEHGAKVNLKNKSGSSALSEALSLKVKNAKLVTLYLADGANIYGIDTPKYYLYLDKDAQEIEFTIFSYYFDPVRFILKHNANSVRAIWGLQEAELLEKELAACLYQLDNNIIYDDLFGLCGNNTNNNEL